MAQGVNELSTSAPDDPLRDRRAPAGVDVVYAGNRSTVAVTGRVDRSRTREVSGTVRGLLAVGVDDLIVDLTHAWDGAALLTVLARTRADLADRGGTLRLVGVALPEFLAALIEAPLDEVFLIYDALHRNADERRARSTSSVGRRSDWLA